jgi:hypothetical protein
MRSCCHGSKKTAASSKLLSKALVEAIREGRPISPAAEWLVDNYHIVEEQLREIRHDLPPSYYTNYRNSLTANSKATHESTPSPSS